MEAQPVDFESALKKDAEVYQSKLGQLLAEMVQECCDIYDPEQFDRTIQWAPPGHGLVLGKVSDDVSLSVAFELWCSNKGVDISDLPHPRPRDMVDMFGVSITSNIVRRVDGLRLRTHFDPKMAKRSCNWYVWEAVDVILHFTVLMILPSILMYRSLEMQYVYSYTMAPIGVDETEISPPVMWYNLINSKGYDGLYMLPLVTVIMVESLVYLGLAILRMSIDYLELGDDLCFGIFGRPFRMAFGYLLHFQMWLFGIYIGLAVTWSLLAALLNPEVYLVHGVAATCGIVIIVLTYKQMMFAANVFRSCVTDALNDQMKTAVQKTLQAASKKGDFGRDGSLFAHGDGADGDLTGDGQFDARDLFHILNQDGDDTLSIEEFKNLFTALQIDISQEKQDMLLAVCDLDCSGTIDEEEFANAWDYFHDVFLEEAADAAGLSGYHIVVTVVLAGLILVLMFVFIFLAISAWSNEGNFATTIRSLILTFVGGSVNFLRPRTDIESGDPKKTKEQVDASLSILKTQNDDS